MGEQVKNGKTEALNILVTAKVPHTVLITLLPGWLLQQTILVPNGDCPIVIIINRVQYSTNHNFTTDTTTFKSINGNRDRRMNLLDSHIHIRLLGQLRTIAAAVVLISK